MCLKGRALAWHTKLSEDAQLDMPSSLDYAISMLQAEVRKQLLETDVDFWLARVRSKESSSKRQWEANRLLLGTKGGDSQRQRVQRPLDKVASRHASYEHPRHGSQDGTHHRIRWSKADNMMLFNPKDKSVCFFMKQLRIIESQHDEEEALNVLSSCLTGLVLA